MQRNGLDTLRLLAALMVMWGHAFALHGDGIGYGLHAERAGVGIFFLISGCLVTQSWGRDPNVLRFAARRALRIMPALVIVVALTDFVLGPFVTSLPTGDYLRDAGTWAYLRWAVLIPGSFQLPGVFPHNPGSGVANGSLWTLPLEAFCYALVAAAGLLRDRAPLAMFGVLLLASWGCYEGGGMTMAMIAVFASGGLLAAFGIRLWVPLPTLPVDISYGVYLYAYPVQQIVIMAQPGWSAVTCLGVALPIVLALAFLSWRLVERPALRLKPGVLDGFIPSKRLASGVAR
jgi:peptidoglycan/LPS O-acetylase OafA/YrhL